MRAPRNYQRQLIGVTLGVVGALLIWPGTSWLVRDQMKLSVPTPSSVAAWDIARVGAGSSGAQVSERCLRETAHGNPDDYELQLAVTTLLPPEGEVRLRTIAQALRQLEARFPNRPGLIAAILRFSCQSLVRLRRDEAGWLMGTPAVADSGLTGQLRNTPEQLAEFDQAALEGERLDPNNAYFPFIRSVGLFQMGRDKDALAEIELAASKSLWNDYVVEEAAGDWKLHERTFGRTGALQRTALAASVLYPHFAELRNSGRVAVAIAARAEQGDNVDFGIGIRDAVRTCGRLMRVQSTSVIGSLVGASIEQTTLFRPAGATPIHAASPSKGDQNQRIVHDFESFLARAGRSQDEPDVAREVAACTAVREIVKQSDHSPSNDEPTSLAFVWLGGMMLLSSALWMLILGGLGSLLSQHPRIQARLGIPAPSRTASAIGMIGGPVIAGAVVLHQVTPAAYVGLAAGLLASLLMLLVPRLSATEAVRTAGSFGLALTSGALFCSVLMWQFTSSVWPVCQMIAMFNGGEGSGFVTGPALDATAVLIATVVPLLTLLGLTCLSLATRVPLSVGVARGLRACGVPIGCFLLLAYCGVVPGAVGREAATRTHLERSVEHEGRFIASTVGREWPGMDR